MLRFKIIAGLYILIMGVLFFCKLPVDLLFYVTLGILLPVSSAVVLVVDFFPRKELPIAAEIPDPAPVIDLKPIPKPVDVLEHVMVEKIKVINAKKELELKKVQPQKDFIDDLKGI